MHLSCCIKLHRRPTTSIDEVLHGRSDSSLLHVPSHTTKLEPLASSTHSTFTASPPPTHTGSLSRVVHWVVIAHATVVDRLREAKRCALGARPHRPSCRCVGVWPLLGVVYMHVQRQGCPSNGTGIGEEWCVSGGALPRADEGVGAG